VDFVTLTEQIYKTSVIFLTAAAVNPTVLSNVRSEVLAVVLMKFKDLWDVMLHHCVSSSGCFEGVYSLRVQGEAVQEDCVRHHNPPEHGKPLAQWQSIISLKT